MEQKQAFLPVPQILYSTKTGFPTCSTNFIFKTKTGFPACYTNTLDVIFTKTGFPTCSTNFIFNKDRQDGCSTR